MDTECGEIEVRVDREYRGPGIDGLIADIDKESGGIFHHVGIGQDHALLRDEHTAAEREGIGFIVNTHDENGRRLGLAIEIALGIRQRHVGSGNQQQERNEEKH